MTAEPQPAEAQPAGQAWFRTLWPVPPVPRPEPTPASSPDEARVRVQGIVAAEFDVPEATRSRLLEPDGAAAATIVIWHGFTNAPSQFAKVGEALRADGYRVLLPRMPHHGQADLLTRDLANLTDAELVGQVNTCIDIATGFGDPVWAIGLSAGATLAAWAAATRPEVRRLVLAAPLVAPTGVPLPLIRAMVRFPRIVPRFYYWWDPRKKADLGHSPYSYPGFPVPGLMPYLHLSEAMFDHSVIAGHLLERVVLVTNPGDFAIRKDAARAFAYGVFAGRADRFGEANVDGSLKWMHDFVDPYSPGAGTTEQAVAIFAAALGIGEPTAGGVLVPPLVPDQL
jgi:pimeloyl-ACP methyl ester carboxylesterase